MRILFCTSECAPFSKTGGLADVASSLPYALKKQNNKVAIITPLYKCVKDKYYNELNFEVSKMISLGSNQYYAGLLSLNHNGIKIYFIDNEQFFYRDNLYGYDDDKLRFAFFSKAIVDLIEDLEDKPQILHCNDWQTALIIVYLKTLSNNNKKLLPIKTVFTIHNIAYQGQFGRNELVDTFGLPDELYESSMGYIYEGREDVNLMKGAMILADVVNTVSPTYAKEIHYPQYGKGLQGVCDLIESKLYGILNGIDMEKYDPSIGLDIPCKFSIKDMDGKMICKKHIQSKFNLNQNSNWPLFVISARLVKQKGFDLIKRVLPILMEIGSQMIILGQGQQEYVDYFNECVRKYPGQFGFSTAYSDKLACELFAGGDLYLMPSEFEPCGLSQMMAMRYGTVPIVYETGGLKDSIRPYSDFDGIGDGFSFSNYRPKDLYLTIMNAIRVFFADRKKFDELRLRCMKKDFSWKKSALKYQRLYQEIIVDDAEMSIDFNQAFDNLKKEFYKQNIIDCLVDQELSMQVHIDGPATGTFYLRLTNGNLEIEPFDYEYADAFVNTTYDNLMKIILDKQSIDVLFLSGQLKVSGNLSKAVELKNILFKN